MDGASANLPRNRWSDGRPVDRMAECFRNMNIIDAQRRADEVLAVLRPLCLRCEVAGSVRRKKPTDIKDIEIVLIPHPEHLAELKDAINNRWGTPQIGAWPSKYCKIRAALNLDIFTVTPETWGLLFFIRTGPAEFGQRALTFWKTVTNGGYSKDGILHLADGTPVPTPEEEDVFRVLEKYSGTRCPFVPPERRLAGPGKQCRRCSAPPARREQDWKWGKLL